MNTIRTLIDRRDQRDRTSVKHLERVRRDMGEERTWPQIGGVTFRDRLRPRNASLIRSTSRDQQFQSIHDGRKRQHRQTGHVPTFASTAVMTFLSNPGGGDAQAYQERPRH